MASSTLMSIGMRAMFANTASLNVTGHNIANANVEGYSRQEVELATASGQFTGAGFFGKGVNVVNVKRAHDQFLTMQAAAAKSMAAADESRYTQLSQLEDVFPPGDQGLGYAMGDFFAAMVDLANSPGDSSARQAVLARAADVSDRFSNASNRLDVLQAGVRSDMENSAQTVTALAARVADINKQIAANRGQTQQPNDLLDQRDQLISQISQYVNVTTIPASDGTVGVFLAGGHRLVLGGESAELTVRADDLDASRVGLAISSNGSALPLSDDLLTSGSIAGLLRFQNDDLVTARNRLGQMALAFASQVNHAQSMGIDLNGNTGSDIFEVGAPLALPAATNARDVNGQLISNVSIDIADASLLQASDYSLQADPNNAGQYELVRLSDGLTRSVADGDTIDGFTVHIGTPAPTATDRFLLQPVGQAASGMHRVLDDPNGVAAALPVQATLGLDNTGTATIDLLRMTDGTVDPELTATITFSDDTGAYTWELRDRTTGALASSGTGQWTAGEPIELNGFALELNGVPLTGDTVTVDKTLFPATNNGNALAQSRLADESFVGRTLDGSGNYVGGATATDAYADTMANIGVRVQSARVSTQISNATATQMSEALASKTGVNLDEEAARLIQFQQGYQAAAKVLQVAQSVFDTMLQIGS
ncbi:flagellar hook-associated protein FlgK [Ideonella sp. DXS29W]|uniref:Flagellar hook-associated protein 1 n=1 Tax=Ideonella lacteola TaxID=2984193 RepID=A0ABU9C1A9_9BURK